MACPTRRLHRPSYAFSQTRVGSNILKYLSKLIMNRD
jgi:hypothetical protein